MSDLEFIKDIQKVLDKYKEELSIEEMAIALDYLRSRLYQKKFEKFKYEGENTNG